MKGLEDFTLKPQLQTNTNCVFEQLSHTSLLLTQEWGIYLSFALQTSARAIFALRVRFCRYFSSWSRPILFEVPLQGSPSSSHKICRKATNNGELQAAQKQDQGITRNHTTRRCLFQSAHSPRSAQFVRRYLGTQIWRVGPVETH